MDSISFSQQAIAVLDRTSKVLSQKSNEDKFYNTNYGMYLEQMAQEMYKYSLELQEMEYRYGSL